MLIGNGLEEMHKRHIQHDVEVKDVNCISGANTPYYESGEFFSEDSDHCPRSALFRAIGLDRLLAKNPDDQISHKTGRVWEELVVDCLKLTTVPHTLVQEYEHRRQHGSIGYCGHCDFVIESQGVRFAIETKTLQSGSTCEFVIEKDTPKLGALLQLLPAISSLQAYDPLSKANFGFLAYAVGSWFDHYSFETKKRLKFKPGRKTFYVTIGEDGLVSVNEKPTQWWIQGIDAGIAIAAVLLEQDRMPPMPTFCNFNREKTKYDVCAYCKWKEHGCKDYAANDKISNFAKIVKASFNVWSDESFITEAKRPVL
jgi:hypothetical protein